MNLAAALAKPRSGPFTFEDFCALVPDGQKGDLIDGVIYVASPESIDANELFIWFLTLTRLYVRKRKLGRVFGSRVTCRLDKKNSPEPDILFVSNQNLGRVKRKHVEGAADLAVEIVSAESAERDYQKKVNQYQQFGFREYWILDEEMQKVLVLRLNEKGKYQELKPRKGVLHSEVMTGFWLDPHWLWQRPLPDELDVLQKLLGETK